MGISRQSFDDLAWDRNDDAWAASQKLLMSRATCDGVRSLAMKHFGKPATLMRPVFLGGFNILYRLRSENSSPNILVRLPCPDLAQFPEEKIPQEAATAACVGRNTSVPTPEVLMYGEDEALGPFIMLRFVESPRDMSDALAIPEQDPDLTPVLNPDLPETRLQSLYGQMARCLLQLSELKFCQIGSLLETEPGAYTVARRPITQNMNSMVQLANIPRSVLPPPGKTFATADEWYVALATMHLAQLSFQHNDLVTSPDDCRNKYVARQLFFNLAKSGRLSTFGFAEDSWSSQSKVNNSELPAPNGTYNFRLWSDDFRPVNVLLNDDDNIAAVIDWEFAYAAPTQFTLDPPWWLLLEMPEMWSDGIEDWSEAYEKRLWTWLSAMEEQERVMPSNLRLSTYMRESWDTGRFWLNYAARKSYAFDAIYWTFLDERFFGLRREVPSQAVEDETTSSR